MPVTLAHTSQGAWLIQPTVKPQMNDWVTALRNSRASFLATTALPEDPAEALRGGLILTPLMGMQSGDPLGLDWAMLGEWLEKLLSQSLRTANGHVMGMASTCDRLHPQNSTFPDVARPIFEQGALSPMSVFPADFPILCLPGDKLFQSKDVERAYCLPPVVRGNGKVYAH